MWPRPLEKWCIYVYITASWGHFQLNKDKKQWNFCPPNQQNVKDEEWAQLFVLLLEFSNFSIYRRGSTSIDSNVIRVPKTGFITFAESSAAPQSTRAPSSGSLAPPAGCRPRRAPAGAFRRETRPLGVASLSPSLAWPLWWASRACGAMATWIRYSWKAAEERGRREMLLHDRASPGSNHCTILITNFELTAPLRWQIKK